MSNHSKSIIILPLEMSSIVVLFSSSPKIELREPVYSSIYFVLTLVFTGR